MQPFVKWAGGKRQLIPAINERLPKDFNTYYEPFIGGGALFFSVKPQKAIIGDVNTALINTYKQIRTDSNSLMTLLDTLTTEHNEAINQKEYYLKKREEYNSKVINNDYSLSTISLFLYLNKTCFNGLYRVNSKGLFNVPFNNVKKVNIYSKENLEEISSYLKDITIFNQDFEKTCENAGKGDFVFFDSPYAPIKSDSFEAYTKEGFAKEEHERLAKLFKKLTEKGAYCMLTNHNVPLIRELYKDYNVETIQVKRMINSDSNNRVGEEVIITNY